jgi:hypothetical protein
VISKNVEIGEGREYEEGKKARSTEIEEEKTAQQQPLFVSPPCPCPRLIEFVPAALAPTPPAPPPGAESIKRSLMSLFRHPMIIESVNA